jgi:hypothetical protein
MYSIGQKLWYVPRTRHREPHETTITKIGKVWIYLENGHRVDIAKLYADGGQYQSPGRAYLSREVWEQEVELIREWDSLSALLRNMYSPPHAVTAADIRQAKALLRLVKD